jgi:hypothetical protein
MVTDIVEKTFEQLVEDNAQLVSESIPNPKKASLILDGKEYDLENWVTLSHYSKKNNIAINTLMNWVTRNKIKHEDKVVVPCLNNLLLIADKNYA